MQDGGDPGVQAVRRLVHRVLGHHPVGGVLAARDHDQAGHRVRRPRARGTAWRWTRTRRSAAAAGRRRRPRRPRGSAATAEHRVDVLEQVVDVGASWPPGGPSSSDQSVSVVPMIQCRPHGMTNSTLFSVRKMMPGVGLQPVPGHHQVDALGRAHVELAAGVRHRLGVVGPHPGGVDHLLGADLEAPRRSPGR